MRYLTTAVIILICFFATQSLSGQSFEKIDSLANVLITKYNLPGIGIVGVEKDKVIYIKGFGKANQESDFSDSTRIYIASNTKAFVALAIARLANKRLLNYSDPISRFIDINYFPPQIDASKITIRQLLTHTHGLSNDPLVFRTAYSGEYPQNLQKLLKFCEQRGDTLSHDFHYSNLGYLLAGIIIENICGQNWGDYLYQNIFKPLRLNSTTTYMNFPPELEAKPYGYDSYLPISSKKTENCLHAAGGIYSTLDDIGRWLTLFTDREQNLVDHSIMDDYLSEGAIAGQSMGPFKMDRYNNGWIKGSLMGGELFFHFGSFKGYESMISYRPSINKGVFVFINERYGGQRIAAMLNSYFYMIAEGDPEADDKIGMFFKFIDPLYQKESEKNRPYFTFDRSSDLTGTYYSEAYGQLIVDKNAEGYIFRLGKLQSKAFVGENENSLIIEWTPGITEKFEIIQDEETVSLKYGEYGTFVRM